MALLVSVCAHVMAAVTVGALLRSKVDASPARVETLDVDVVPAPNGEGESGIAGASPPPVQSPLSRASSASHKAARRAPAAVSNPGAASPAPAADDATSTARFVLIGTIGTRAAAGPSTTAPPAEPAGSRRDIAGEGEVGVPARLLSTPPLVYPPAARRAEIEIDVPIEIVVDTDGRVSSARALSRAGYGLDEAALRAIRAYRFSPALRAGRPSRVRMRWTVQFRLR